jgi:hypothetical protein
MNSFATELCFGANRPHSFGANHPNRYGVNMQWGEFTTCPTSPHCQFASYKFDTQISIRRISQNNSQKNYKNRGLLLLLNFTPRHGSLCARKCVRSAYLASEHRVSDRKNRDFLASNPEQNLLSQICRFGSISYEVIDK